MIKICHNFSRVSEILSNLLETCVHMAEFLNWLVLMWCACILYHYFIIPSVNIIYMHHSDEQSYIWICRSFPKDSFHIYTQTRTIGFSATSAYFRSIIYPQPRGTYSLPDDILPCLDTRGAICSLPMYQAAVMKWSSITPVSSATVEVWKVH